MSTIGVEGVDSGYGRAMGRSFVLQLMILVVILLGINLLAALAGWDFRVSIIGSVLLTLLLTAVLSLFRRRA